MFIRECKMSDEELDEVTGGMKIVVVKSFFTQKRKCPTCGMEVPFVVYPFHLLSCHGLKN